VFLIVQFGISINLAASGTFIACSMVTILLMDYKSTPRPKQFNCHLLKNIQLESVLTNFAHMFSFICLEKSELFLSGKC